MDREHWEPARVFGYFTALTRIPRGSGNEQAVSEWLLEFGRRFGWQAERDAARNVRICLPATPGLEAAPRLTLQAHMDMVCAKEPDVSFDFATQPLDIYCQDGYLRARGTTLGADDGIGVALILALLEELAETGLSHPALQALFTAGEETMLIGAQHLDAAWLNTDWLVGLDYSSNEAVLVSCAGISLLEATLQSAREQLAGPATVFTLRLYGLLGGHSAKAIHLGRANAIQLLAGLAEDVLSPTGCRLLGLSGGDLLNTIPDNGILQLACPTAQAPAAEAALRKTAQRLRTHWLEQEPDLHWELSIAENPNGASVLAAESARALLGFLTGLQSGAYTMIPDAAPPRAGSSTNLGLLREKNGAFTAQISTRSNEEALHDALLALHQALADEYGWKARLCSRIAAWEYQPDSELLRQTCRAFAAVHGHQPPLEQIHAGVEGGIFQQKAATLGRSLQVVNIGCTTLDVHTPRERLKIDTVSKTYRLLQLLLEGISGPPMGAI